MHLFRRRLRTAVIAWMLFQVVSLSALVPRDCCDAHRPAAQAERCHETAESSYCPMRAQGRNCPMHAAAPAAPETGGHAHHGVDTPSEPTPHETAVGQPAISASSAHEHASHAPARQDQASRDSGDRCRVVGTCSAPMTALAVILSNHGVVPAGIQLPADADRAGAPLPRHEHVTSRLIPPNSPPPRA
jgi:hypothetical protein